MIILLIELNSGFQKGIYYLQWKYRLIELIRRNNYFMIIKPSKLALNMKSSDNLVNEVKNWVEIMISMIKEYKRV